MKKQTKLTKMYDKLIQEETSDFINLFGSKPAVPSEPLHIDGTEYIAQKERELAGKPIDPYEQFKKIGDKNKKMRDNTTDDEYRAYMKYKKANFTDPDEIRKRQDYNQFLKLGEKNKAKREVLGDDHYASYKKYEKRAVPYFQRQREAEALASNPKSIVQKAADLKKAAAPVINDISTYSKEKKEELLNQMGELERSPRGAYIKAFFGYQPDLKQKKVQENELNYFTYNTLIEDTVNIPITPEEQELRRFGQERQNMINSNLEDKQNNRKFQKQLDYFGRIGRDNKNLKQTIENNERERLRSMIIKNPAELRFYLNKKNSGEAYDNPEGPNKGKEFLRQNEDKIASTNTRLASRAFSNEEKDSRLARQRRLSGQDPSLLTQAGNVAKVTAGVAVGVAAGALIANLYKKYNWRKNQCNDLESPSDVSKCKQYLNNREIRELKSEARKCKDSRCREDVWKRIRKLEIGER